MEFHKAERRDRRGRRLLAVTVLGVATVLASAWVGLFLFLSSNAAVGTLEDLSDRYLPDVDELALDLPRVSQLSEVFTADGVRLGFLTERNSRPVPLDEIPDTVLSAVLAAEDAGYFEHEGLDFRAIVRAGIEQVRGGARQGASTITQQVVRQNFGTSEITIERKLREAVVAAELERRYTKEEIVEFYMNSAYFGSNAYGVKAAAQEYFGKELSELTVAEAAAMVTAIRNPSRYDPRNNREDVLRARNAVIDNMAEEGFITPQQAEAAKREPLVPKPHEVFTELAPEVMIATRDRLLNDPKYGLGETFRERKTAVFGCPAQDIECELGGGAKGGLTVFVTVDYGLQEEANRVLREWFPAATETAAPTGAIAMVDNRTGAVQVMASGLEFGEDIEAGERPYDIAGKGRRNPGSSFKPIGLVAALESGRRFDAPITLGTYWDSSSPQLLTYPGAPKPWECRNAGGGGGGLRSLEDATVFSTNAVYCQVALATGADNIVEMAHRLGIESPIEEVPSVIIGSQAVTPLEMAQAFSTLANYGEKVEPYLIERIEDADGNVIYQHEIEKEQVIDRALAASVVRTLEQAVSRGTGRAATIGRPQAGKTGTHQNFTDAWFMGFIPQYTTAVWVGFPDAQVPMRDITINGQFYARVYGGTIAAPVWQDFMTIVTENLPVEDFPEDPEGMAPYYTTPSTTVPAIPAGASPEGAAKLIRQAGLGASIVEVPSDLPQGVIVSISPGPGARVRQGSTVTIQVSSGVPPVVPFASLIGLTLDQAQAVIDAFQADTGLAISWVAVEQPDANPVNHGRIVATAPGPGAPVADGATVTVFIGVPPSA